MPQPRFDCLRKIFDTIDKNNDLINNNHINVLYIHLIHKMNHELVRLIY